MMTKYPVVAHYHVQTVPTSDRQYAQLFFYFVRILLGVYTTRVNFQSTSTEYK
jgi:hypothetical protein